jgi:trans-aconitate 2-methyltransferase
MPWDPERYHQFQEERSAPFGDLLGLVHIRPGLKVIDLGCGTGELTRRLAERLPGSQVLGIDASPEMLERARSQERPGLRFESGLIEQVKGQWDLVFSNAAIQWVDDHPALVPRLLSMVRPGGQLVIQMPSNHSHPTHTLILEVASQQPFRQALGGWTRRSPVLTIDAYARLLYDQGGSEIAVFEKIYPHVLADADALADWTSGTALVPYFERLGPELRELFMERYRLRLWGLYPGSPVFYGFRRILLAATRPSENFAGE